MDDRTHTVEFSHNHDDRQYLVSAEYSEVGKRLTINLDRGLWKVGRDGFRVRSGPVVCCDWYDWTDRFLDEEKFRALVLSELEHNWPLDVFGRLREDGDVDILHKDCGSRVTRLDRPGVYPVDSDLSVQYEHAAGIVLTVEDCRDLGIEVEQ